MAFLKDNRGFGLLEIVVSISIILVSVMPIITFLGSVVADEIKAQDKLKAIYFAEEGVEMLRKIRDDDGNIPLSDAPVDGDRVIALKNTNNDNKCRGATIESQDGIELISKTADSEHILTRSGEGYIQCENGETSGVGLQWKKSGFQRYVNISYPQAGVIKAIVYVKKNGTLLYSLMSYLYEI